MVRLASMSASVPISAFASTWKIVSLSFFASATFRHSDSLSISDLASSSPSVLRSSSESFLEFLGSQRAD